MTLHSNGGNQEFSAHLSFPEFQIRYIQIFFFFYHTFSSLVFHGSEAYRLSPALESP